jgi:hypothetical protein
MSPSLDDVFGAVNQQVTQLSHRWNIFRQLFDSGPESIELLNRSGSIVFGLLQRLLIDDAILTISRLTDPAGSNDRQNASVPTLLKRSSDILSAAVRDEFEHDAARIHRAVDNVRVHRNKAIAHADLHHALNASALPPLTYDEIESAIKELCKLMTDIARALFGWTVHHNVIVPFGHGGTDLLNILVRAHKHGSKEQA